MWGLCKKIAEWCRENLAERRTCVSPRVSMCANLCVCSVCVCVHVCPCMKHHRKFCSRTGLIWQNLRRSQRSISETPRAWVLEILEGLTAWATVLDHGEKHCRGDLTSDFFKLQSQGESLLACLLILAVKQKSLSHWVSFSAREKEETQGASFLKGGRWVMGGAVRGGCSQKQRRGRGKQD